MNSQEFEVLCDRRAVLADRTGFAERCAHQDPANSLLKQRRFIEHAVVRVQALPAYRVGPLWKIMLSEVDGWVRNGGASDEMASQDQACQKGSERTGSR